MEELGNGYNTLVQLSILWSSYYTNLTPTLGLSFITSRCVSRDQVLDYFLNINNISQTNTDGFVNSLVNHALHFLL
jgi:hypothetical protein